MGRLPHRSPRIPNTNAPIGRAAKPTPNVAKEARRQNQIATFAIELLLNYAIIGVWAPILLVLLRVFQGIAVGGEWGGAVLMALEQ